MNKLFSNRISLNCESYHFERNLSLPADETDVLMSWMWILGFWKMDFQSRLNFHSRHSISKQTLSWQFSPHYTDSAYFQSEISNFSFVTIWPKRKNFQIIFCNSIYLDVIQWMEIVNNLAEFCTPCNLAKISLLFFLQLFFFFSSQPFVFAFLFFFSISLDIDLSFVSALPAIGRQSMDLNLIFGKSVKCQISA